MQALEAQGVLPPHVGPEQEITCDDANEMFARAKELRREGKRVVLGGGSR